MNLDSLKRKEIKCHQPGLQAGLGVGEGCAFCVSTSLPDGSYSQSDGRLPSFLFLLTQGERPSASREHLPAEVAFTAAVTQDLSLGETRVSVRFHGGESGTVVSRDVLLGPRKDAVEILRLRTDREDLFLLSRETASDKLDMALLLAAKLSRAPPSFVSRMMILVDRGQTPQERDRFLALGEILTQRSGWPVLLLEPASLNFLGSGYLLTPDPISFVRDALNQVVRLSKEELCRGRLLSKGFSVKTEARSSMSGWPKFTPSSFRRERIEIFDGSQFQG